MSSIDFLQTNQKFRSSHSFHRQERGVGLIEVLFAVLILAIGLLGMAGLQLTSIRNSQSAMTRGIAVVQAYSIISAIQSDRPNVSPMTYNLTFGDTPASGSILGNWRQDISDALGSDARGAVNCTAGPATDFMCQVSIRWNDSRVLGNDDDDNPVMSQVDFEVVIL